MMQPNAGIVIEDAKTTNQSAVLSVILSLPVTVCNWVRMFVAVLRRLSLQIQLIKNCNHESCWFILR